LPVTIIAQSDADEATVPEPSTLLLVSAGLLASSARA
jgi:hypothetical protein